MAAAEAAVRRLIAMNVEEIKSQLAGAWASLAPEVRPSRNPDGTIKPFFLARTFVYRPDDQFELTVQNYADATGKVRLASLDLAGSMAWRGDHPVAASAQKVDFTADRAYGVTPLLQGFVDLLNKVAVGSHYARWELGKRQDILRKPFA